MKAMPMRGQRTATNKAKKAPFKPCPGCPSPAACKAKGQCAKKMMMMK